jgi:gliding motility-associated-like protein
MKYIQTILFILLICLNIRGQSNLELCDTYIEKQIRANTSANISWSVTPLIPYQVNNDMLTLTFRDLGTYVITATFSNGVCYSENKLVLNVIECKETFLWVPSAFTPDGDGDNDLFGAYGINIKEFKIVIWDKWGQMLFFSHDLNKRWNGKFYDRLCQDDVYTYRISYRDINNKYHEKIGRVTLFK